MSEPGRGQVQDVVKWTAFFAIFGAAVYFFLRIFKVRFDEDRPPIIVRGGSLHFVSGDEGDGNPIKKNGKRWVAQPNALWTPHQANGRPVSSTSIRFRTNDPPIPLADQSAVGILFQTEQYEVRVQPRGPHGPARPVLHQVRGGTLIEGGTSQNPTLERDGGRTTFTVTYTPRGQSPVEKETGWVRVDFE